MKKEIQDLLGGITSIRQIPKPFKLHNAVVKKNNLFEVKIQNGKMTMPLFATVYIDVILKHLSTEQAPTSIMLDDVSILLEFDDAEVSYKKLTKFKSVIEESFKANNLTGINDEGVHYLLTKGLISVNNYSDVLLCVYVEMDIAPIVSDFIANNISAMTLERYNAKYSTYLSREFFNSKLDKYMKVVKESLVEPFIADNDIEVFMNKNQMIYNICDLLDIKEASEVTPDDVIDELLVPDMVEPVVQTSSESATTVSIDDLEELIADLAPTPVAVESQDERPF